MALIANVNRGQKSRAYKPNDFNPYAKSSHDLPTPEQIEYLKTWPANPS